MATEVLAVIRVASVADQMAQRGETQSKLEAAVNRCPPPQGRYGGLLRDIAERRSHSHDSKWGYCIWLGTLSEFSDVEALQSWWWDLRLAISETQYLGIVQGVLQYGVDGQPWVTIDHFGGLTEGMETVGDE